MKSIQFECLLCNELFTEIDIINFRFFIATRVCYTCYRSLQKSPFSYSCFGKKSDDKYLGYDSLAHECRELCPDRKICPGFVNKKLIKLRKLAEAETVVKNKPIVIRQYPFRPSSLICKAFKLCMKGVPLTVLKRWCKHRNKNHNWVLLMLRKENKNGRRWRFNETRDSIKLDYPLSR